MTSTAWAKPRIRIVGWCISTVSSQLKWKQISTIRMWSIPDFTDKCAMCGGISRKRTLQRPPFEVKSVSRCQSVRLRIPLGWASLWTFRTQIRSEAEIFETWLYLWFHIAAKSGIFSFWRMFTIFSLSGLIDTLYLLREYIVWSGLAVCFSLVYSLFLQLIIANIY